MPSGERYREVMGAKQGRQRMTWMGLETVILSEGRQTKTNAWYRLHVECKKEKHKWTYLQDRNGVHTYGYQEERGGKLGDWDWHTHTATAAHSLQLCLIVWPCGLQPIRLLLSMAFSRQEYWSGLPCPQPGDLPNPGVEPRSPVLQAHSLLLSHQGSPVDTLCCVVLSCLVVSLTLRLHGL